MIATSSNEADHVEAMMFLTFFVFQMIQFSEADNSVQYNQQLAPKSLIPSIMNSSRSVFRRPISILIPNPKDSMHKKDPPKGMRRPPELPSNVDSDWLILINEHMTKVIDPVSIGTGIVANTLVAIVFLKTPLRLRPFSHAAAAISLVNLLYLLGCLISYLSTKGLSVYSIPGACQLTTFTLMFSRSLEAWFLLLSHINRLNAHTNGSYERRQRRVFNTKFAIVMLVLLACAPAVHVLWSFESVDIGEHTYCLPMQATMQLHLTIRKIELISSIVIPVLLMIGVDLLLLLKLAFHLSSRDSDQDSILDLGYELNQYTGSKIDNSPFCSEKIVKMPLQNGLSTLKETSESHDRNSNTLSLPKLASERKKSASDWPVTKNKMNTLVEQSGVSFSKDTLSVQKKQLTVSLQDVNSTSDLQPLFSDASASTRLSLSSDKTTLNDQLIVEEDSDSSCDQSNLPKLEETVGSSSEEERTDDPSSRRESCTTEVSQDIYSCSAYEKQPTSFSYSQWRSYDYTSFATIGSRSHVVQEDQDYPTDIMACTLTVLFIGVVYAALTFPSTYSQCYKLFMESPQARPTHHELQKAIFFESLVKINAMYKFFVFLSTLASFRKALSWCFIQCVVNRITRISVHKLCKSKNEEAPVEDV